MKIIADLHIHSHYSRATSKNLNFEHLTKWAQLKGVNLLITGDVAHPGWLQEMKDKLEPAEDGLFRLKDEVAKTVQEEVPAACQGLVRFMLGGEISSIYKKHERVRKVHNMIYAPTLDVVEKIQAALEKIGNIRSDGRPILGLPSRDLLEIILDIDPQNYLIPAHIWTPWFSLLGSKSGYDTVESCFEDLSDHIFAVETGLSSDPPMNWRVSMLDKYTLVSNSDAHSPQKLAREATLFETEMAYSTIFAALKSGDPAHFRGTIEFFPEEGKYHHDGHRKCAVSWEPQETLAHNERCSVCGKPVTVGVLHRVEALADRTEGQPPRPHPFASLIPLPEVLGEIHGVGPNTKTVKKSFDLLLAKLGPELSILQELPLEDIERVGGPKLAEGIRRMRLGEVQPIAGYDGQPGVIKLFGQDEAAEVGPGQMSFFVTEMAEENTPHPPPRGRPRPQKKGFTEKNKDFGSPLPDGEWLSDGETLSDGERLGVRAISETPTPYTSSTHPLLTDLNPEQQAAILSPASRLVIVAGPGTGKTRTLTTRIAHLIQTKEVAPDTILAITFTNKAAAEMAARLENLIDREWVRQITLKTFHALGAMLLRQAGRQINVPPNFAICSEQEQEAILKQAYPKMGIREIRGYLADISTAKSRCLIPAEVDPDLAEIYETYQQTLAENGLVDFDDLIFKAVQLLESQPDLQQTYQQRFRWISVDEFQDVNLAQYRLLQLLLGAESNVCLIGDPDQAIYGFRGATPQYFAHFKQDFPPVETLPLSQNYRSTQLILEAAEQVIEKSPASERVKIWSEFLDRTKLMIYQAPSERAEAEYIVQKIEKMVGGTSYFSIDSGRSDNEEKSLAFADFAVLYRLGAQSPPLLEALQRSGIPFQSVGQTALLEYKEIRLIVACLWLLHNPQAIFHLEQVTIDTQRAKIIAFCTAVAEWSSVANLIQQLYDFLTGQSILTLEERGQERVEQLERRAVPFVNNLGQFLEALVLQKETDFYDPRADRVTLMTLHAAKGLEFPVVFIVGCEEGLLPYQRGDEPTDFAEERRLFYVGLTRAQQKLVLTQAKSRYLFGQPQSNPPSRFVEDIEQTLKEVAAARVVKPRKEAPENPQLPLF